MNGRIAEDEFGIVMVNRRPAKRCDILIEVNGLYPKVLRVVDRSAIGMDLFPPA